MSRSLGLILSFILILFASLAAHTTTIQVPTDYPTIQAALDAASASDTIVVAPGTYRENVRITKDGIQLRSTDPTDPAVVRATVIDAQRMGSVITVTGEAEDAVDPNWGIFGFTITNGSAEEGGGIAVGPSVSGGSIEYCEIHHNRATRGGGIFNADNSDILHNHIYANEAISATPDYYTEGGGGMLECRYSLIEGNTIEQNYTNARGGGMKRCGRIIRRNWITDNVALLGGGGMDGMTGWIENNVIAHNRSPQGPGAGYLAYLGSGQGGLAKAGAPAYDAAGEQYPGALVSNNIVFNQAAPGQIGGADMSRGNHPMTFEYCILWGNGPAPEQIEIGSTIVSNCIQNAAPELLDGQRNIAADPRFVNVTARDYRLRSDSPCINAGYPALNPPLYYDTVDFRGLPRKVGAQIDMGAYEAQEGEMVPIPPTVTPTPRAEELAVFVLDDFGAVHTGGAGNNIVLTGGAYFGWNIARDAELVFGLPAQGPFRTGMLVLDGYGALHSFSCSRPPQSFYFSTDVAVNLAVFQNELVGGVRGAIGGFVLDRQGALWACGTADSAVAQAGSISPALDGNVTRAVDLLLADATGKRGWIMDNHGAIHGFGGAEDPAFPVSTQGNWKLLVRVEEQLVRIDASGMAEWSGTPPAGWDLPMLDGDLLADVEVEPGHGLVALDRFGALYPTAGAVLPPAGSGPPYFGFEVARDLEIGPPFGR